MTEQAEKEILDLLHAQAYEKAFNLIVGKLSRQVYWQIRKMVLSHDDANDVLQNTFIKAWGALPEFRGDSKISTWLYKIATNESLSFLTTQRAKHMADPLDLEDIMIQNLQADPYFSGDEAQLKLQKAIAQLPEKQRLVFNMKYFDEMKYEDMSEILGTSVGALKASYHIAVQKIEAFLKMEE
ncbi:MAG: RNA polymerase sigma factor [Paludibacteraceae bacterium]|jgi:RNA polymerase sigma-70 factor (ECF subfamily)|nr:RNA polymerase sigma factor [Paludibacteraceae bacterium]